MTHLAPAHPPWHVCSPSEYTLEEAKQKAEQDALEAAAEAKKQGVREYLTQIRSEFEALLAENEAKPEAERLPRSAFEIDVGLREMVAQETARREEVARKELAWETEKRRLALAKLKKFFLDNVSRRGLGRGAASRSSDARGRPGGGLLIGAAERRALRVLRHCRERRSRWSTSCCTPSAASRPSPRSAPRASARSCCRSSPPPARPSASRRRRKRRSACRPAPQRCARQGGAPRMTAQVCAPLYASASPCPLGTCTQAADATAATDGVTGAATAAAAAAAAAVAAGVDTTKMSKADLRRLARKQREAAWAAFNATRPDEKYEDPADVAAIDEAERNMGDFKLKSDPTYVVPEEERMTPQRKRYQMLLLEEAMHGARMDFNRRFLALREVRDSCSHACRAHGRRLDVTQPERGAPQLGGRRSRRRWWRRSTRAWPSSGPSRRSWASRRRPRRPCPASSPRPRSRSCSR